MDLEDIVEVGFRPGSVLEDFVFVTSDFEAFLSLIKRNLKLAARCMEVAFDVV